MGSCLSSGGDSVSFSSALVISPTGDLRPYSTPVFVSDVLQMEPSPSFVCNSDKLSYDEHIRAMDTEDGLDAGQIYFVLPVSKLRDRLSASEMAALAVKASVALNSTGFNKGRNYKKSKISPFVVMESNANIDEEAPNNKSVGVSRSRSIRKRTARLAVRSFKLRLSTIYETESSHKRSNDVL
ncbi:hypothetical protein L1987_65375 [Smallanthus sonchifolius]|uniref:Uncharacterized protein n=1 Tax=Smallanthus sonchifolius TaxID=185202 RepID=A0ACB9BU71_9ASTR|nr:hypothetical protein L1987_65375 [Smallanthus sonchifolius]